MNLPARIEQGAAKYAHIESLAQVRPPYPAQGSADWWALRQRVEEIIARDSRRRGTKYTEAEVVQSDNAKRAALGEGDSSLAYERNGFTREQWLAKWNPTGRPSGRIPQVF
jgi:hypothetical protein